jgi:hypothetical protein
MKASQHGDSATPLPSTIIDGLLRWMAPTALGERLQGPTALEGRSKGPAGQIQRPCPSFALCLIINPTNEAYRGL